MLEVAELERLSAVVAGGAEAVVLGTTLTARRAELQVDPGHIVDVLERLRGEGYNMLASLHGLDYFPEEPRLGVSYELLSFEHQRRISVKVRVPLDAPNVPSVTDAWPTANFHER
nr:NADH-quinone oxidoreductase subunit C [Patulibacter sp.]